MEGLSSKTAPSRAIGAPLLQSEALLALAVLLHVFFHFFHGGAALRQNDYAAVNGRVVRKRPASLQRLEPKWLRAVGSGSEVPQHSKAQANQAMPCQS